MTLPLASYSSKLVSRMHTLGSGVQPIPMHLILFLQNVEVFSVYSLWEGVWLVIKHGWKLRNCYIRD